MVKINITPGVLHKANSLVRHAGDVARINKQRHPGVMGHADLTWSRQALEQHAGKNRADRMVGLAKRARKKGPDGEKAKADLLRTAKRVAFVRKGRNAQDRRKIAKGAGVIAGGLSASAIARGTSSGSSASSKSEAARKAAATRKRNQGH